MKQGVCLITGATSGIGRAVALKLAELGLRLIIVGRNDGKMKKVIGRLERKTGNKAINSYKCDLSSLRELRNLAGSIRQNHDRIDVLINNAGAKILRYRPTADGIESTLASNHVGHFLLTLLLTDLLAASKHGRVINVSSGAHYGATGVIRNVKSAEDYDGRKQYAESKLANVLFTYAVADKLKDRGISVNAMSPGGVATNFARNNGLRHWLRHIVYHLLKGELRTPAQGAETIVYLATSNEVAGATGKYFEDKKEKRSSDVSYDKANQEALWAASVEWSKVDL